MVSKGNTRKRAKRHGFRKRMRKGGAVVNDRRSKGRKRLSSSQC